MIQNKRPRAALNAAINSIFLLILIFVADYPSAVSAQWVVNPNMRDELGTETVVAYTRNQEGYTLEIYKDSVSAIRGRITLDEGLLKFEDRLCPSYQIDQGTPGNVSINGASCLAGDNWAEYILAYARDGQIVSPLLLSIMNGNAATFRFRLENGDYRQTTISLLGSKRSLTTILGEDVTVTAR